MDATSIQIGSVLRLLKQIEAREPRLSGGRPHIMRVGETAVWRRDADLSSVPDGLPDEDSRPRIHRGSATLVRLGKFSTGGGIRARAFYTESSPPLTVKLELSPQPTETGVARELVARKSIAASGLPAPTLVGGGAGPAFAYLIEEMIRGRHVGDGVEKQRLAESLIPVLLGAHRRMGTTDQPMGLDPDSAGSVCGLIETADWGEHEVPGEKLASRADLVDFVGTLVDRAEPAPVGWIHGDLVFSNIIIGADGQPVLIDWEYSRRTCRP